MAELSGIARPYANAVFELAQQQDELAAWGDQLDWLAAIAADAKVARLVKNPRVTDEQLQQLILQAAADSLQAGGKHLLKLLIRNGRLGVLPEIARLFAARRAAAENTIAAEMITAAEINATQRAQFTDALQNRLGCRVQLEFAVDQDLLGGAVLRAGDWVIDGSVRAQLEQLVGALNA